MVAPALVLLNPYTLGAAAAGASAVTFGLVKRETLTHAADEALRYSMEMTLKAAPWVIAGLWRPGTIIHMAEDSAPPATDAPAPSAPATPASPQFEPPQGLFQKLRRVLGTAQKFVQGRWYLRWAPVPLGVAYAFGRVSWAHHVQEKNRADLAVPVPDGVRREVSATYPSLVRGIDIAHRYPHDEQLMVDLIPKLFSPTFTPDGALLVIHALLETLSLHPAVGSEKKRRYVEMMQAEFQKVIQKFARNMEVMELTGVLGNSEAIFSAGDITIQGRIVKPGMQDLIEEMRTEKKALQEMTAAHIQWVGSRDLPPHVMVQVSAREKTIDERLPLVWGGIQAKIGTPKIYMDAVQQSFEVMRNDFVMKNLDVWEAFEASANAPDAANSTGSMLGVFGAMVFLKPGWMLIIKSIPFMFAGSLIEGAHAAIERSSQRHPIKFCLPGYGTLCDIL